MCNHSLHLLVDTNLFFECKKLEDLPWDEFGVDEVVLLVARPVLDEIDKHKKRNGRTRSRAVEIWMRIRELIKDQKRSEIEIGNSGPRVTLKRAGNVQIDPAIGASLDLTKNDDRLIGILSSLKKDDPSADIRLFSHDTGPISSAEDFGLPFEFIPDHWLRPRQETAEAKEVNNLRKQLSNYQTAEPQIEISVVDQDRSKSISQSEVHYEPLTGFEIDQLIEELERRAPKKEDFSVSEHGPIALFGKTNVVGSMYEYSPPSEDEIRQYSKVDYPAWLEKCREKLADLHSNLQTSRSLLDLKFSLVNLGSRPAEDVRVRFVAHGPISLYRFSVSQADRSSEPNTETARPQNNAKLPIPPEPPKGKTVVKGAQIGGLKEGIRLAQTLHDPLRHNQGLRSILRSQKALQSLTGASSIPSLDYRIIEPDLHFPSQHKHDPETFYYDGWTEATPVKTGELTADLWRHQTPAEIFELSIEFEGSPPLNAAIDCEVHASNLTIPAKFTLPVLLQETRLHLHEIANQMVAHCTSIGALLDESATKS